jgi:hypothetical protein
MNLLKGKKTYIVAIAVGLVTVALQLRFIDMEMAQMLYGLLGATGIATLRAGIKGPPTASKKS